MRSTDHLSKGPFRNRLGVWVFALLLGLLLYWLGSYGIQDIAAIKPPEVDAPDLKARIVMLDVEAHQLGERSQDLEEQLNYLRQSTLGLQSTMDQLLDLRRQYLDKAQPLTEDESRVFAESQRIFLENHQQYQEAVRQASEARNRLKENERARESARNELWQLEQPLYKRHKMVIATIQFVVLLPFVILGGLIFFRIRSSRYVALVHAHNAAALALLFGLIHAHFPRYYYKYLFLALAIVVVAAALVFLIRQFAKPSRNWLLQRYIEGYRTGKCPVCMYPIETGKYRWMHLKGKAQLVIPAAPATSEDMDPYTCPSCGTALFAACDACGHTRHTLLPHCVHCGIAQEAVSRPS